MILHLRTVWALLIGVMLLALGNGLQGSLVGIRATAEDFSATATGIIMSGYYLGLFLSSFVTPNLVTKVGHIRVFAALAAVDATAVLMFPLYVEPLWWLVLRLTAGVCTAGLYIVCESWLNAAVSNQSRGRILSIYMIIVYGSLGAGQLLLNVPDTSGFTRFIIISVLLSLSLVPIALAPIEAPVIEEAQAVNLRDLYRSSPLALVATFANGLGQSAFFSMGAIYGMMQGLPLAYISLMMALPPIGVIVSQYPIGLLSDRYDRRSLMTMLALLTSMIALCSIVVQPYSRDLLIGLFTLFGALSLPIYSLAWRMPTTICGATRCWSIGPAGAHLWQWCGAWALDCRRLHAAARDAGVHDLHGGDLYGARGVRDPSHAAAGGAVPRRRPGPSGQPGHHAGGGQGHGRGSAEAV